MNILGVMTIHPLTVPIGNEIAFLIAQLAKSGAMMYGAVIVPELQELKDMFILLSN